MSYPLGYNLMYNIYNKNLFNILNNEQYSLRYNLMCNIHNNNLFNILNNNIHNSNLFNILNNEFLRNNLMYNNYNSQFIIIHKDLYYHKIDNNHLHNIKEVKINILNMI